MMTAQEEIFSLNKTETKLFSTLITFGAQTKRDLFINSAVAEEKAENSLESLITKGLARQDKESGIIFSTLPLKNLITLLEENNEKLQLNLKLDFQAIRKSIEENLGKFKEVNEKQLEELKTSNLVLKSALRKEWDTSEQLRREKSEEFIDDVLTSTSNRVSEVQANLDNVITSEKASLEKNWTDAVGQFQNIQDISSRILRESITKYEKQLLEIIRSTTSRINTIQTRISDIVTTLETESSVQVQEFFTNTESTSNEFKGNLISGLETSRKYEKNFVNELRKQVQASLETDISKGLTSVVSKVAQDIDKEIEDGLIGVKQKTESIIRESSQQIKQEFQEFVDNASELISEQKSPIDVLQSEILELSTEQKIATQQDLFLKQFESLLASDLVSLETNYHKVQKMAIDVMENIRRDAKKQLIAQSSEFERLIQIFSENIEKSINRKDADVVRLHQLSQSVNQFLRNLLISIPSRATQLKTHLNESFKLTSSELEKNIGGESLDSLKEINEKISDSYKRVDQIFNETTSEGEKEIQNLLSTSDHILNAVSSLHESLNEKVQSRFEQRSKVLNTEIDAVSRNYQQVLSGLESDYTDIYDRIETQSISNMNEIETNLHNSTLHLKTEVDNIFGKTGQGNREFLVQLEINLQNQIERILNVIKEGFSQIKKDFTAELNIQIENVEKNNKTSQDALQTVIDAFSGQTNQFINTYKSEIKQALDEREKMFLDLVDENRRAVDEVIGLHKSQIAKYQEKGPTDILTFISQIETEVLSQNKNLKDALEEIQSVYDGLYDSTMVEVSGLIKQVQENAEKLSSVVSGSLQTISTSLLRTNDQLESYFAESISELENQLDVATGFVTSEIETSSQSVEEEVQVLRSEMEDTIKKLSTEIKDSIAHQDQEYQTKIPEISQNFSQAFDELIQERAKLNQELEQKTKENLSNLTENWQKQLEKAKNRLQEVTESIEVAIQTNIENMEIIADKNTDLTIKRLNEVLNLDSSEDLFGLNEIKTTVKQYNKRIKTAINDSLKTHLEDFDKKLPELINSYDAIHNQTEEDVTRFIEDFTDMISSYQTSFKTRFHEFLTEERQEMDFSEIKEELSGFTRDFSQVSTKNIEDITNDLTGRVQISLKNVNESKEKLQELFTELALTINEENKKLLKELGEQKENIVKEFKIQLQDLDQSMNASIDTYYNDLEKNSLSMSGNSSQLIQILTEEFDKLITEISESSNNILKELLGSNNSFKEGLQILADELAKSEPLKDIRFINLANEDIKTKYITELIKGVKKQVTIFTSNPTLYPTGILTTIPSEKRIYFITNYDFTKKGKKWANEVEEKLNIVFHSTTAEKLTGTFIIADDNLAIVIPDDIGIIISDPKLVPFFSQTLNSIKGRRMSLKGIQ